MKLAVIVLVETTDVSIRGLLVEPSLHTLKE
ncbi:unannotated protein [freshwater metagenome]|uniref:Unannotated protein n=1 Tax=freshwater metagenome TaxID=449393 RepID=A0A6J7SR46_9ZZZZ